ncbi:MAG: hypothetical protein ACJ719_16955 [Nitrososphaeraceae archaeon]|jgi:hypothetical protein
MNNSQSKRDKVISYLHQCKQRGLLFERIRKGAASNLGEFSWDRKFMVDKCDTCKNFGLYNVFS